MTEGSTALTLLRAGVSFVIVLGLLILFLRILASRTGVRANRAPTAIRVDVLTRRQLSRGSSIQVVEVSGRVLVLGVTDTHVRVLTRLSAADVEKDDITGSSPTPHVGEALRRQGEVGKAIAALAERQKGRHRG